MVFVGAYHSRMSPWIDSHCHLDAPEFVPDAQAVRSHAAMNNVAMCVIPAVGVFNFDTVRTLAHETGDSYALGIHPLFTPRAQETDLVGLEQHLHTHRDDPRLVAVGEIGLDYFVEGLDGPRQEFFYVEQLRLARRHGLPVILHVRRSADRLLRALRQIGPGGWTGIAHAFNGSAQQAQAFIDLGFKLGFGGAVTYDRALKLREMAASLPLDALVLETDAPDIPPHWLYTTAEQRIAGQLQGPNSPAELPRIAAEVAHLRGISVAELAQASTANARSALKGLPALALT